MGGALGVDLSTTATGLVVLTSSGSKNPNLELEDEVSFKKLFGIALHVAIVRQVLEVAENYEVERIVVEGYSLNLKNSSSVIPLVSLGALFRFCLWNDDRKWLAPSAGELKKFVVGKGNATKDHMMMHVLKRWGHESKSNNTADAYGLACMGLVHIGKLPGASKEMLSLVGSLKLISN